MLKYVCQIEIDLKSRGGDRIRGHEEMTPHQQDFFYYVVHHTFHLQKTMQNIHHELQYQLTQVVNTRNAAKSLTADPEIEKNVLE